jgi:NADH-quinone oxidoreductase subunit L
MVDLVWAIPALPLLGFVVLLFAGRRMGEPLAGWFATAMVGGSFLAAVVAFLGLVGLDERLHADTLFTWVPAGDLSVDVGVYLDPLSAVMVLFVTGVAALIHLYSVGYMHGDPRYTKFFLYMNLFVFSMLVLVLGDNLLLTFLGWEGVGACSYFLISFWHEKPANATAGKKAFVTNRIGDWGFMVAMFMAFFTFGSLSYAEMLPLAPGLATTTATFIAVMLFVGAIGKSAQIPLFVWLPDAMAGPTPVSALIHAATMVTAGVYLLCRMNPVLEASADWVPMLIAWTGAITALVTATIAVAQNDIKKILAYSTVSQLGFMFIAVGIGAYWVAIFHMITHAFFKACLFLGAGSVIHGMHDNQDVRVMGALRKVMPITAATFLVEWLAIAGVPPFSGFFSKDEILTYAFQENIALYAVGMVAALLTAFYMSRQVFLVFFGDARWKELVEARPEPAAVAAGDAAESVEAGDGDAAEVEGGADVSPQLARARAMGVPDEEFHELPEGFTPHESPWTMTVPLVVLAVAAATAGLMNLPFPKSAHFLENWLEPVFGETATHLELGTWTIVALLVVSTIVALAGIAAAYVVYLQRRVEPVEPEVLAEGWYIDRTIAAVVGGPGTAAFDAVATADATIVDGAVNAVGGGSGALGDVLRRTQSGLVRRYAGFVGVGGVLVLAWMLTRAVA